MQQLEPLSFLPKSSKNSFLHKCSDLQAKRCQIPRARRHLNGRCHLMPGTLTLGGFPREMECPPPRSLYLCSEGSCSRSWP